VKIVLLQVEKEREEKQKKIKRESLRKVKEEGEE